MDLFYNLIGMGFATIYILVILAVAIAVYVFQSYAHMKALKALGYDKAWLAWIPYANYYACADAVSDNQENVYLFEKYSVPALLFKIWWVIAIVIGWLPINSTVIWILKSLVQIVFLGAAYTKMYARLEYKSEQETQVMGCLSGFLPIIAAIKFIAIK